MTERGTVKFEERTALSGPFTKCINRIFSSMKKNHKASLKLILHIHAAHITIYFFRRVS